MEKKEIIIFDGKRYEYKTGRFQSGEEACEACPLNNYCNYEDDHDHLVCHLHNHLDDNTGNYQLVDDGEQPAKGWQIDERIYKELRRLGILGTSVRAYNRGASDYAQHVVQPWTIWLEYNLNPWDADIVKRVLRNKQGESRRLDYEKIIHICEERIRQIDNEEGQDSKL